MFSALIPLVFMIDGFLLQDDAIVHHMVAKVVENISTVVSGPSHPLVTTEMGSALWYLFTHSSVEAVRVTAISVSETKQTFKPKFKQICTFTFHKTAFLAIFLRSTSLYSFLGKILFIDIYFKQQHVVICQRQV